MGLLTPWTAKSNPWDIPDIRNLGEVIPGAIYRSAAPGNESWPGLLAKLHIKSVLDLRDGMSESQKRKVQWGLWSMYGIAWRNIPLDDKSYPDPVLMAEALAILQDPANYPILVHCEGGRHRTGGLVALYRKRVQGWTPAAAYAEAKRFGFYASFGHGPWKRYILEP